MSKVFCFTIIQGCRQDSHELENIISTTSFRIGLWTQAGPAELGFEECLMQNTYFGMHHIAFFLLQSCLVFVCGNGLLLFSVKGLGELH